MVAVATPVTAQETVRCTADSYGSTTYTRCSNGVRTTSERIGTTVYTRGNDCNRSTLEEIGGAAHYRSNSGVRGMVDSYGTTSSGSTSSTSYYRDNTGRRATLDRYDSPSGSTALYRDNQETRGTFDTYGTMTTGRITRPVPSPLLPPRFKATNARHAARPRPALFHREKPTTARGRASLPGWGCALAPHQSCPAD